MQKIKTATELKMCECCCGTIAIGERYVSREDAFDAGDCDAGYLVEHINCELRTPGGQRFEAGL